ncbi:MAG: hypothetical protein WCO98_13000 [bacterium]
MFNLAKIFGLLNYLPMLMQLVQSVVDLKGQKPPESSEADEALLVLIRNMDDRLNKVESENEALRNRVKNLEGVLSNMQVYLYTAIGVAVLGLIIAIIAVSK